MNLNNEKIVVAIENAVIEQVEASGFTGELHRLDGEKIIDVILQQIEGFVLVPKEPTLEMCHRGRNTRTFKVQDIYKAMIEAQEQSHERKDT